MIVPVITAPIIATAVFVALFNKTIDTSLLAIDHMLMPRETEQLSETLKVLGDSNTIIKDLLYAEIEEICESQTKLRNQLKYDKLQRNAFGDDYFEKDAKVVHEYYEELNKEEAEEIEKAVIEPVDQVKALHWFTPVRHKNAEIVENTIEGAKDAAVKEGTSTVVDTDKEDTGVVVDTDKEVSNKSAEIVEKTIQGAKEAAKKAYKAVTNAVSSVWKTVSGWFHWRSIRRVIYLRDALRGLSLTVELLNLWEHVIIPHDPTNNTIDYTGHENLDLTHANDKLKLYLNSLRTELPPKGNQNANETEDKIEESRNKEKLIKLFDTLNTNFIL